MSWMQMALLSTALMVVSGYFGGRKFSPGMVRNITGGLGVLVGLTWQGALGFGESGTVYRIGFIIAGYAAAMGILRARGVDS
jgi:hypothetical protein